MHSTNDRVDFLDSLDQVAQVRTEMATALATMAQSLAKLAETCQLGLDREREDLTLAAQKLREGVFRLMVLGDMKRGKSTFLNALLGEQLLPSDVNPCTALLTILRYGPEKQVTVHFINGQPPEDLDFETFKQRYTIPPAAAKDFARKQELAFPEVSHAVVTYPLALLAKGIEIVDSPGLNDTEARNELSLGYIQNCHAILFMLRATQPCTLSERRYLETYIQGRGLSLFFLINAWDQIQESLLDPDDPAEVAAAEARLHQVFRSNLQDYCQVKGQDLYAQRVFPISALAALRRRLKSPTDNLDGTGFPPFMTALSTFLRVDRARVEFSQGLDLAQQIQLRLREAIGQRIPLLDQSVTALKQRILSVAPEFEQLVEIRDRFQQEIREQCDRTAQIIADSFRTHILELETTFEQDFLRYQPDLQLTDFISPQGRTAFSRSLKSAFEQYLSDQFVIWAKTAEQPLNQAFQALSKSAASYGASYREITQRITEKLTGQPVQISDPDQTQAHLPGWAQWAVGLFSLAGGNVTGMGMALTGFNIEDLLLNLMATIGIAAVAATLFGVIFGPITFALVGLSLGTLQANKARQELVKVAKVELMKHLPKLAQDQWQPIYHSVQDSFKHYEQAVIGRIDTDIIARKGELEQLLAQKQTQDSHRETEIKQLQTCQDQIEQACEQIYKVYQF